MIRKTLGRLRILGKIGHGGRTEVCLSEERHKMHCQVLHGAGVSVLCFCLLLYGRQSPEQRLGPGFGQRYLVLTTTRISTMQGELRQAAGAGYRVLAGWSAPEIKRELDSYSYTSSQIVMLLEKVAARPSTYEYMWLSTFRSSTLRKEMREAGARGYRLVPQTEISDTSLLMEKAPASSERYDYLFPPHEGAVQGYAMVGMACSCTGGEESEDGSVPPLRVTHVLVAEKSLQPVAEVRSQESPTSARARYVLLVGEPGTDLKEMLSGYAEQGYRLVLTSDASCPKPVLVMEDVAQPGQTYQYLVARGEDELNAAATRGFHPHPSGIVDGFGIIMERTPGSKNGDKYFLLEKTSSSALQERLIDAGMEGLDVVAAGRTKHVVILRKSAGKIAELQTASAESPHLGPRGSGLSGSASPEDDMAIRPGSRIYVQPMDGFGTYLISALKKKKVPLVVVFAQQDADFEISGAAKIHEASKAVQILEAVGGVAGAAAGQQSGDFPRKLEVTISVRNVRTGAVILEHSVQKHTTARALAYYSQSAAEACADHVKKKIQEPKSK